MVRSAGMRDRAGERPLLLIPGLREKGYGAKRVNRTKNRHRCP